MGWGAIIFPGVILCCGVAVLALRWSRGQSDPAFEGVLRGLIAMPGRYLRDVHDIVARHKPSARMHVLTAGGLLLSALLLLVGGWPLRLALFIMCVGAVYDLWRRWHLPRTPGGVWWGLPLGLLGFAALHLAGFAALANCALALALVIGPLSHATKGAAHLAFHSRPDRFDRGTAVGALKQREQDGVTQTKDFAWTELLAFDACVACGRCDEVCPALSAGQPLSPRDMIRGLGAGQQTAPDALWSCTTCGACVEACPMLIEHVDAVAGQRQGVVMTQGTQPQPIARATELARVRGILTDDNPADRWQWAVDMGVSILPAGGRTNTLLWLGQGGIDPRARRTLRAFIELLNIAGEDFAILGPDEADCGDIPLRSGDLHTFEALARSNLAALSTRHFTRIVTADPHAAFTLGTEYQRFGSPLPVEHHSVTLRRLIKTGAIVPAPGMGIIAVHDPCYLARYIGGDMTGALGATTDDMRLPERHGRQTLCCGAGGGAGLADVPGTTRPADIRMETLRATGATTVAVGCPNCAIMLEGAQNALPVLDLAEIIHRSVQGGPV